MHPCILWQLDDRHVIFLPLLTEKIAVDRRSCWCWGKPTFLYLWPVTDVFQLNMHCAEVQLRFFFAFDIIHLFSVVFYVVRTAHKLDFGLVMKAEPNKWWPVERKSWSDGDLRFWQDIYVYSISTVARSVRGLYLRFAGRLCSLRRRTVLVLTSSKMRGLCCTCAFTRHRVSAIIWANSWRWWWSERLRSRYEIIRYRLHIRAHFVCASTLRASLSNTKIRNR
jgi:hypothetical protein